MFYEAELRLLRETFKKCRIQTNLVDLSLPLDTRQDLGLYAFYQHLSDVKKPLSELLPAVSPATVYRLTDPFHCRYLYLLLPELSADVVLMIGPYLPFAPSAEQLMEWTEGSGISPAKQKHLQNYYSGIPILPANSHLFVMLDAFSERLWGINGYCVEEVSRDALNIPSPLQKNAPDSEEQDALWNIRNMEMRYSYENELIDAVTKGQVHKGDLLLSSFSSFSFEQRLSDPVRNAKNYCIIMNTLLRKAAEQGGVHPVYIDNTSSAHAARIEQVSTMDDIAPLMSEMFRSYCRLVRHHSMRNYSPPVQKIIALIDSDLTADLSLRVFSKMLNVSGSYLSTLFKKETGQTLSEYINNRRIKHAMHLLKTTRLQIQTIAQYCGIMDVQYFSKVFKRVVGVTPKEYRESLKY